MKKIANKKLTTHYVPLPVGVLTSAAFRILNIHERRCLDRLMLEHARHIGRDNGRLPVTHKDFIEHGVHAAHIASCLRVLEALGLVVCTERGRGANAQYRRPNLFRITFLTTLAFEKHPNNGRSRSEWCEATNEWSTIETIEAAKEIAAKHRPHDMRDRRAPKLKQPTVKHPTVTLN